MNPIHTLCSGCADVMRCAVMQAVCDPALRLKLAAAAAAVRTPFAGAAVDATEESASHAVSAGGGDAGGVDAGGGAAEAGAASPAANAIPRTGLIRPRTLCLLLRTLAKLAVGIAISFSRVGR